MNPRSIPAPTITRGSFASRASTVRAEPTDSDTIREFALIAARAADDRKANDVLVLDVAATLVVTDVFVIASASNSRLVAAIVDAIEGAIKEAGGPGPTAVEGLSEASWVLMDYAGFVVHVFADETRKYYDLERLFADSPVIAWQV
jgi:ribosome-associated protein